MATLQGTPCWFELTTTDLDAATSFYSAQLGWTITDSGMPGMKYLLAAVGDAMVAGLFDAKDTGDPPQPPNWGTYLAVEDCDATVAKAGELGGAVVMPADDIPGTGRFAVLADPQGAVFGILQPLPMEEPTTGAFATGVIGHGQWIELMTPDQGAGFEFYSALFGWQRSDTVEMGEMGEYWIFSHDGAQVGGMMPQGNSPVPAWMPYFGVDSIAASKDSVSVGGGAVIHGPAQVPGGQWTIICTDPQGVYFGLVGQE